MKQKKINLSLYAEDYKRIQRLFKAIRISTFILSTLVSMTFGGLFITNSQIAQKINTLTTEKNNLLESTKSQNHNEAAVVYLNNKLSLANKFLDSDTKFIPYYNLLLSNLNSGSDSASLQEFAIDNSRTTTFKVQFKSKEEMLNYLKYAESDSFLNNFSLLSLTGISLSPHQSDLGNTSTGYTLSFQGKFNALNENNN